MQELTTIRVHDSGMVRPLLKRLERLFASTAPDRSHHRGQLHEGFREDILQAEMEIAPLGTRACCGTVTAKCRFIRAKRI